MRLSVTILVLMLALPVTSDVISARETTMSQASLNATPIAPPAQGAPVQTMQQLLQDQDNPEKLRTVALTCTGPVLPEHQANVTIPMYSVRGEVPILDLRLEGSAACVPPQTASPEWKAFPELVIVNVERLTPNTKAEQAGIVGRCDTLRQERHCLELSSTQPHLQLTQRHLRAVDNVQSQTLSKAWDVNGDKIVELLVLAKTADQRGTIPLQRAVALLTLRVDVPTTSSERTVFQAPSTSDPDPCGTLLTTRESAEVILDRTGVASVAFLNPRRPAYLGPPTRCTTYTAEEKLRYLGQRELRFRNRVADRSFVVTFSDISELDRAEYLRYGVRLESCRQGKCSAVLQVNENLSASLPLSVLWASFQRQNSSVSTFTIAFFEEDTSPANAKGYFTMAAGTAFVEPADSQRWTANTGAVAAHEPDLNDLVPADKKPPVIQLPLAGEPGNVRDAVNRWRLSGNVVLGVTHTFGVKASGEFEIQLKDGDFGTDPSVSATKFRLNIHGANGLSFSGGRFDIASPSYGIAMRERGDAVAITHPYANLLGALIIRKEQPRDRFLADTPKDPQDRDHWAVYLQAAPVLRLGAQQWGQVNVFGVYGQQEQQRTADFGKDTMQVMQFDRHYETVGAEWLGTFNRSAASVAVFGSRTRANTPDERVDLPGDRGHGYVALATFTRTNLDSAVEGNRQKVDGAFNLFFGLGSGDETPADSSAKDTNEGYVGETGNFTPDLLFLSRLAPLINTDVRARSDDGSMTIRRTGRVGRGLANKTYFGATYTDQRWSLLQLIARGLQIPADDLGARSTTVKLHYYRFNQRVFQAHDGGTEFDLEFKLDSPRGVKYTMLTGVFWPGAALKDSGLIAKTQWLLSLGVSVKM
jgi:hypothetical protein